VSTANVGAAFACEILQQALQLRLRQQQRLHRGVDELREVDVQTAERESGRRAGLAAGRLESLQHTPVPQQIQDSTAETAGLRNRSRLGQPLQHQRSHARQAQLAGQRQAGRGPAHDDHVGIGHSLLPNAWSLAR
jgi:hypothetical protein